MSTGAEIKDKGVVYLDRIGIIGETKLVGLKKVEEIVDRYKADKKALPSILADIQAEYGWIPENALEYVAQELNIPISKLYDRVKKEEPRVCMEDGIEYYPECKKCGTVLTKEPFTDINTVTVRSFWCPECGEENWFYIDLERMFRNKNRWCPVCEKFTRDYTDDHECPCCGGEVYRTKTRTNKERAIEYYPRCPDCRKIISKKPFTDLSTVTVVELYCSACDKSHWLYIDLERIYEREK